MNGLHWTEYCSYRVVGCFTNLFGAWASADFNNLCTRGQFCGPQGVSCLQAECFVELGSLSHRRGSACEGIHKALDKAPELQVTKMI